jgi:thioredoxin reductase
MQHDVIVVGGSYAGIAAALQLLRARRSVLVIDTGLRRNRFASRSHGFLGQDGVAPEVIVSNARRQLENYPTLSWIEGAAAAVDGHMDDFAVTTADGQTQHARRVLLATGVSDQLAAIEGLAERWGRTVFHCPYCHGYELGGGPVGVIAASPMSAHQAELLTDWGEVTFLCNGGMELEAEARYTLESRQVKIEETPIERIEGSADVLLSDGRRLAFAGLFTATRTVPASRLPQEMGCELEETPMGTQVRTDDSKQTTLPGVFACGDLARAPHSISLAVGDGAMTGMHVHRSLVWPG